MPTPEKDDFDDLWEDEVVEAPAVSKYTTPSDGDVEDPDDDDWELWDWVANPKKPDKKTGQQLADKYAGIFDDDGDEAEPFNEKPCGELYQSGYPVDVMIDGVDSYGQPVLLDDYLPAATWLAGTTLAMITHIAVHHPDAYEKARGFFIDVFAKVESVFKRMKAYQHVTAKQWSALNGWYVGVHNWISDYEPEWPQPVIHVVVVPPKPAVLPVPPSPAIDVLTLRAKRHRRNLSIPEKE